MVIAFALLAAGCGTGGHVVSDPRSGTAARPGTMTARLVLPSLTMAAGSSMSGRVLVDNDTGRAIHTSGCGTLFAVALASRTYEPTVAWPTCLQRFGIPVGRSSYRVTVEARYGQCGPGSSYNAIKACGPDGRPPPLPPGHYHAILFQVRHLVQAPPPLPVLVTPR